MTDLTSYTDQLITWRRHLHQHPELSFEEHGTVAYIEAELRARGFAISDTEWGTVAKHLVEVEPGGADRLDGVLQAITHGALTSGEAGETWTEAPA